MLEAKVINSWEVKPFSLDDSYDSRMLLDNIVAGAETVQINEGTLKAGCKTDGAVHNDNEIYYVVRGEAILTLGDKKFCIKQGSLVFIPGDVFHALENKSETEDFVVLTFWMDAKQNDMYELRLKAWGKSFKSVYED